MLLDVVVGETKKGVRAIGRYPRGEGNDEGVYHRNAQAYPVLRYVH
jgi:hypothetical protein